MRRTLQPEFILAPELHRRYWGQLPPRSWQVPKRQQMCGRSYVRYIWSVMLRNFSASREVLWLHDDRDSWYCITSPNDWEHHGYCSKGFESSIWWEKWYCPRFFVVFHQVTTALFQYGQVFLKNTRRFNNWRDYLDMKHCCDLRELLKIWATRRSFTRAAATSSAPLSRREQHLKDVEYIKDLKPRTKCLNCGEPGHWSADCKKERKPKTLLDKTPNLLRGISDANIAKSLAYHESSDSCASEWSIAFMAFSSHAYITTSQVSTWYADSAATEHMTDKREWFSSFSEIVHGLWLVTIADDRTQRLRYI